MTQEEIVDKLENIAGFFHARADMAIGDGKMLFLSWFNAAEQALALLKAQEPRVMTLEEVNALDWDYCYLEQERLPGKEYRGMLGKYIMTCVTWPSITAAKISSGAENYGRTWRCWTERPTDEQREATPWERCQTMI